MSLFHRSHQQPKGRGNGGLFAPRIVLQRGEGWGWLSSIGKLFAKAKPYFKSAMTSGIKALSSASKSQTAKDLKKILKKSAIDVSKNFAADLLTTGGDLEETKERAKRRIAKARKDVSNIVRNAPIAEAPKMGKRKAKPTLTVSKKKRKGPSYSVFKS